MRLELTVNGEERAFECAPNETLLDVLRREGYRSVKEGCREGECGACAILLDGEPVNACLVLAGRAQGRTVTTVEGLGTPGRFHPIQQAFLDAGAVQCGYCTPGMVISAYALLKRVPDPTDDEIAEALSGNLCRCTGYVKIVEAVRLAGRRMREAGP